MSLGAAFFGESMFAHLPEASKVAFEGVDYEAFTEAWITWVTKYMSK